MARFGQGFIQSLTQPAYTQGLFELGQAAGSLPGRARDEFEKNKAMEMVNEAVASNDAGKLTQASAAIAKFDKALSIKLSEAAQQALMLQRRKAAMSPLFAQGGLEDPTAYATAAQGLLDLGDPEAVAIGQKGLEVQKLNARKASLAAQARSKGLEDIAQNIEDAVDHDYLNEIQTDFRRDGFKRLPLTDAATRLRMAQAAGFSREEFAKGGYGKIPEEAFASLLAGEKGELKPWLTANGKIKTLRVNDFGRVYDTELGKWVDASELGLVQAPPQVQKIENVAQGMASELNQLGAKTFAKASDDSVKASEAIRGIDRVLPTVSNMYTGPLADIRLQTAKVFNELGIPMGELSKITDTEVFIAESASRVADYIRNLGAGTGISEKDLEYTLKVVGGSLSADATSIAKILQEYRKASVRKIQRYNSMRSSISSRLSDDQQGSLAFFPEVIVPSMRSPGSSALLSPEEFSKLSDEEQEAYLEERGL